MATPPLKCSVSPVLVTMETVGEPNCLNDLLTGCPNRGQATKTVCRGTRIWPGTKPGKKPGKTVRPRTMTCPGATIWPGKKTCPGTITWGTRFIRRRGELCRRQSTPTREGHPRPLHSRAQAAYGRLVGFLYRIARRILYAGGVLRSGNVDAIWRPCQTVRHSHSNCFLNSSNCRLRSSTSFSS